MNYTIPLCKSYIPQDALSTVATALKGHQLTMGPLATQVALLAKKFVQAKYVVPCSSGTSALQAILHRKNPCKQKVCLVPAFTFPATWQAAWLAGYSLYVYDCDKNGMPDEESIRTILTRFLAAELPNVTVVLVDVFGMPNRPEFINDLLDEYHVRVFVDSAQSLGSMVGTEYQVCRAHAHTYSMSPTKVMTAGEGGLIVTNDLEIAENARAFLNNGKRPVLSYATEESFEFAGVNGRMSEMNAAIGVASLRMGGTLLLTRQIAYRRYYALLNVIGLSNNLLPDKIDGRTSSLNYVIYRASGQEEQRAIIDAGLRHGVQFKAYFAGVTDIPCVDYTVPQAHQNSKRFVALPFYHEITPVEMQKVINVIDAVVNDGK